MPKYSSSDLNKRIDELEISDEIKLALMEDITDSIVDDSEEINRLKTELEEKSKSYDDLLGKYKSRFTESDGSKNDELEMSTSKEVEKEVIDIREI